MPFPCSAASDGTSETVAPLVAEFSKVLRAQPLEFQAAVACSLVLTMASRTFATPGQARTHLRTTGQKLPCLPPPHMIDHDVLHQVGTEACRRLQAPERQLEIAIYVSSFLDCLAQAGLVAGKDGSAEALDAVLTGLPCTLRAGLIEVVCSAPNSSYSNPLAISLTAPAAIVPKIPSEPGQYLH